MLHFFLTNTASRKSLVASALLVGSAGLMSPASSATVGTYTFDGPSEFGDNFDVLVKDPSDGVGYDPDPSQPPSGTFRYDSGEQVVEVTDSGSNGNDSAYAVLTPENGSPFNAGELTAQVKVSYGGPDGGTRYYGPSLLGASDGTEAGTNSYVAAIDEEGSTFAILLVDWRPPDQGAGRDVLVSEDIAPAINIGGSPDERIEFTATVNQDAGTANLSAQLFEDDGTTPTATLTTGPRDLSADGTAAVGEVGLAHQGSRNGVGEFDDFRLETTPIPEPASAALMGLGGLALLSRRRRRAT